MFFFSFSFPFFNARVNSKKILWKIRKTLWLGMSRYNGRVEKKSHVLPKRRIKTPLCFRIRNRKFYFPFLWIPNLNPNTSESPKLPKVKLICLDLKLVHLQAWNRTSKHGHSRLRNSLIAQHSNGMFFMFKESRTVASDSLRATYCCG